MVIRRAKGSRFISDHRRMREERRRMVSRRAGGSRFISFHLLQPEYREWKKKKGEWLVE